MLLALVVCGIVYRTPIPVQPMNAAGAIATTQAAQTLVITPAMVWGASLATGIVWLLLGLTGTARYVTKLITRPVVLGIILGLGFMIEGAKMMAQNWWVGGMALRGTSLLLTNRIIPEMFLLLLFGAGYGILSDPTLLGALRDVHMELRLPTFALSGNAVIAITEENNRLFPNRPKISTSTGLMILLSASVGGVPMAMARAAWRVTFSSAPHRRRARHSGTRAAGDGNVLQRLGRHALAPVPAEHPRRYPVLDRCAAGAWRLRHQQGQGRTLRDDGHGRPRRLESRHRLRRRRRCLQAQ